MKKIKKLKFNAQSIRVLSSANLRQSGAAGRPCHLSGSCEVTEYCPSEPPICPDPPPK